MSRRKKREVSPVEQLMVDVRWSCGPMPIAYVYDSNVYLMGAEYAPPPDVTEQVVLTGVLKELRFFGNRLLGVWCLEDPAKPMHQQVYVLSDECLWRLWEWRAERNGASSRPFDAHNSGVDQSYNRATNFGLQAERGELSTERKNRDTRQKQSPPRPGSNRTTYQ